MPISSSKGIHTNKAQLNRKGKEVKSITKHQEEILKDITKFIEENKATDVMLAGDLNENVSSKTIESFYTDSRLFDTHECINGDRSLRRDSTYEYRTK